MADTKIIDFSSVLARTMNPFDDLTLRIPLYMTSSLREREQIPGVTFRVNPNSVSFRNEKRIVRKDTRGGAVFYHWTNEQGRNNDILELDFRGQTGNINLRTKPPQVGTLLGQTKFGQWVNRQAQDQSNTVDQNGQPGPIEYGKNVVGSARLEGFWNLYSLTREPMIDFKTNEHVYYYIYYTSPLLANTFIRFTGFFNRVLDYEESAESPFLVNYSFGFTVLESDPPIDFLYEDIVKNLAADSLGVKGTV